MESIVGMLQRDVWNAVQIDTDDDQQLVLNTADARTIRWSAKSGLTRSVQGINDESAVTQQWPQIDVPLIFAPDEAGIVVHVPGASKRGRAEVNMISQVLLAQKRSR